MGVMRKAAVASAAFWAGKKLYGRRQRRRAAERSQPVPTGGDGYQTEPPTPRD